MVSFEERAAWTASVKPIPLTRGGRGEVGVLSIRGCGLTGGVNSTGGGLAGATGTAESGGFVRAVGVGLNTADKPPIKDIMKYSATAPTMK